MTDGSGIGRASARATALATPPGVGRTHSVTSAPSHPSDVSPYSPPDWARGTLRNHPKSGRLTLANLPTPIHRIAPPRKNKGGSGGILRRLDELGINLYVKRDDMTGGVELGGNKVRKLEFLLADALASSSGDDGRGGGKVKGVATIRW